MPIYEYQCQNCHHHLEILQRMNDEPETYCPNCQTHQLKKIVSSTAFQLKGNGWYETDFKNSNKKTETASKDKSSAEVVSSSEASKTETKDFGKASNSSESPA